MKDYEVSHLEIVETYGGVLACETMVDVFLAVDTIVEKRLDRYARGYSP